MPDGVGAATSTLLVVMKAGHSKKFQIFAGAFEVQLSLGGKPVGALHQHGVVFEPIVGVVVVMFVRNQDDIRLYLR
jgi:hypothetical protein